ncbi:DNA-binding NarL/FixJ family response regulator [Kineococcus xinjiangensis]|uniref:DNA-binding NarL/FixJ family response regulator n=1 Tax=Kineococcus xinjiangensis TaxID=512762 RepID=A0A2S6IWB0_9ACTN|nr:response regulator transcription factor [Kineococcus xinjiangensis]PPK98575.1 DNA-binding NarL/FixJ family response regulator [Kineococcus xinjiangensis]
MTATPCDPATGAPVRVVLVDDQQLVRAGFRMVLDSQPDLTVVAEASDGAEAVELLRRTAADVVLMDVRMPRMDGIEATRRIVAAPGPAGHAPRVVVLTTFDLDEYVVSAIAAGASGFLLKDAPPEEMLTAVRTVHAGDAVIAASSTRRLLQHVGPLLRAEGGGGSARVPPDLTPRELEVLVLMAHGLSNTEIAERFVVSEATVKTHVGRVLAKTGSRDRVQAVVLAYASGLVQPGEVLRDAAS